MKKVKILSGAYGRRVNGIVKPVYQGTTVELENEEADRLVSIGCAEYASDADGATLLEAESEKTGGNLSEGENVPESPTEGVFIESMALEDMSFDMLKQLAAQMGIEDIGKLRSKQALREAIAQATSAEDEEITGAEPPDLSASEVVE